MTIVWIILGVIIVAAAVYLIVKKKKVQVDVEVKVEHQEPTQKEKEDNPELVDIDKISSAFIDLELKLTMSSATEPVLKAFTALHDIYIPTLKKAREVYPNEEITWELGRIALKHMPELIELYVNCSPDKKAEQEESILQSLIEFREEVDTARKLIDSSDVAQLRSKANFIKIKYK